MKITKQALLAAADKDIISADQVNPLYEFLKQDELSRPHFSFTHVLYYFGGMLAIGAMTLFMNLGWESFGGAGIFFISLLYAGVGFKVANYFVAKNLAIPAGISATFVVCLTPLAIYGLQKWTGFWPDDTWYQDFHRYVKLHWLYMELGTLAVGAMIAWKYKYAFLMLPIAVTLWYMTMDVTVLISGEYISWELRQLVSMYTGLLMVGLAFWVDIRSRHRADYAFWIYLFGVIAFWGGLSSQHSDSEWDKFLYFMINLLMIGVGVLLVRRVFVVFGALGSCGYLGHLAFDLFEDSWLFPISLTLIGFAIIFLGVLWQKHEQVITAKTRSVLPKALRELLESKE